jgi:hypothetical protein
VTTTTTIYARATSRPRSACWTIGDMHRANIAAESSALSVGGSEHDGCRETAWHLYSSNLDPASGNTLQGNVVETDAPNKSSGVRTRSAGTDVLGLAKRAVADGIGAGLGGTASAHPTAS